MKDELIVKPKIKIIRDKNIFIIQDLDNEIHCKIATQKSGLFMFLFKPKIENDIANCIFLYHKRELQNLMMLMNHNYSNISHIKEVIIGKINALSNKEMAIDALTYSVGKVIDNELKENT